jgi:UDP-N-acetylmuramoyl-tripeptide--D-alanyl-D-alanine ligase
MFRLTVERIISWCGAEVIAGDQQAHDRQINKISSDSRALVAGDLFLALRGDRFDGHDFLEQAMVQNAAALLIDDRKAWQRLQTIDAPAAKSRPVHQTLVLLVPDTLTALQDIAAGYRMQLAGTVIAVTGSVGKTSTRQMIAACLRPFLRIHETAGNLNNEIGLPQTLLGAAEDDEAVILEMGMRGPGEIGLLSRIARPDIAIITCIGWSHIGRLGSREAIKAAKWEIVSGIRPGGLLILNADDHMLTGAAPSVPDNCRLAMICTTDRGCQEALALSRPADFVLSAETITLDAGQTTFTACCTEPGKTAVRTPVTLPFPGSHHVRNTLFGLAVARAMQLDLTRAAAGAAACHTVGNRQRLFELQGITIMDDSYNASPESMEAALEALSILAGTEGRKLAALGCMLELGPFAPDAHRHVGEQVAEMGYSLLLAYGSEADDLLIGARTVDPELPSCSCADHQEMAVRLASSLQPGDYLLIKGSRSYAMEQVTALLEEMLGQAGEDHHVDKG